MTKLLDHMRGVDPRLALTGDGVEDDQELVHAGDQGDLLGLACGQQASVEGLGD